MPNVAASRKNELPSAHVLIQAVGDGQDGSPRGGFLQRGQDRLFRIGVEVGGDLVQEKNGRLRGDGARDGKELPLPLGEETGRAGRVIALIETAYRLVEANGDRGLLHLRICDGGIIQGDLIPDRTGNQTEVLFYIAEEGAFAALPAPVRPETVTCSPGITVSERCDSTAVSMS